MKNLIVTFLILTALSTVSYARIRHIPDDFTTIQAGINACFEEDTVLVDPGTYNECISFIGSHITVASLYLTTGDTSFISSTIIDGQQSGTVVTFHQYDDYSVVLKGFTIRNGNAPNGGGIFCARSSSPTITDNIISNNTATGYGSGGGIFCDTNSAATIVNNYFMRNAANYGGAVACGEDSYPLLRNNTFSLNNGSYGGGISIDDGAATIIYNTMTYNSASTGGAIYANTNDATIIRHNEITHNNARSFGGGVYCGGSGARIDSNLISNNRSSFNGGGIMYWGAYHFTTATNNTINDNSASSSGGGIYLLESYNTIVNNRLSGNVASDGGAISCSNFHPSIIANNIVNNRATHSGGGIIINSGDVDIVGNLIAGNRSVVRGGGVYTRGSMYAKDNIIYGNAAKRGAAICCAWDADTLINNTITLNRADSTGSLCFLDSSRVLVSNIICWADTLILNNEIFVDSISTVTIRYSDISGGYQGPGNIDADPLFAGLLDFRLTWVNYPVDDSTKSPCIDSGDPASPPDSDGTRADMGALAFDRRAVGISEPIPPSLGGSLKIQNYPNPFNITTTISYFLPASSDVTLEAFDILGRRVGTLLSEYQPQGSHSVIWSPEHLASGIYLFRITSGQRVTTQRCLLLK